jgi:hypothetical protein
MRRCPWCGVRNLDSDTHCFNCEGPLIEMEEGHLPPGPDGQEGQAEPLRARRASRKKEPLLLLIGSAILYKLFYLSMTTGFAIIVTLLVMWLAYDNLSAALLCFSLLVTGALFSFIYPDVARRKRNGRRGGVVAFISDLVIVSLLSPPILIYLERKTIISSAVQVFTRYFWAYLAFLLLGFLVGLASGAYGARRTLKDAKVHSSEEWK